MVHGASYEGSGTSSGEVAAAQRKQAVLLCATQVTAGLLLLVAVTVLPLATYKDLSNETTTLLRGGSLGLAVGVAASASIVLSILGLRVRSSRMAAANLALGCLTTIGSIALALIRIAAATDLATLPVPGATGGTQTSYAIGTLVAIVASLVLVMSGISALSNVRARSSAFAPGAWLADPTGAAGLRWWDGQQWTEYTAGPTGPPSASR